ncbi:hypothetical protein PO124_29865 [Bacillus licheniformis]|nr:hypothetical protein [Bacillus licheniformis]
MSQLANCPRCNALFMKSSFQTVCASCLKEEERAYEIVYKFLKNRKPAVHDVSDRRKTGVEEELILKFIRQKRIQISNFPNLGYPCERCGTLIREGRYCMSCEQDLASQMSQLDQLEQLERERNNSSKGTYYTFKPKMTDSLN